MNLRFASDFFETLTLYQSFDIFMKIGALVDITKSRCSLFEGCCWGIVAKHKLAQWIKQVLQGIELIIGIDAVSRFAVACGRQQMNELV